MTRSTFMRASVGALAGAIAWAHGVSAQEPTSCATPVPGAVQHFEGDTSTVTDAFVLPVGTYLIRATFAGAMGMSIYPTTAEGTLDWIDVDGGAPHESLLKIEAETPIRLEVNTRSATAPWTIDIEPAFP